MITPGTGRRAQITTARTMGRESVEVDCGESSLAGILNAKITPTAASSTSGMRPVIFGYHCSMEPQKGTAQKCAEYAFAFKMIGANNKSGMSAAEKAHHIGMSIDRRCLSLASSPAANGSTKRIA